MSPLGYVISSLVIMHTIISIIMLFGVGLVRWTDQKKPKKAQKESLMSGAFDSAMGMFYAMILGAILWPFGPAAVVDGVLTLIIFFILYSYLEMLFSAIYLVIRKRVTRKRGSAPELVPA